MLNSQAKRLAVAALIVVNAFMASCTKDSVAADVLLAQQSSTATDTSGYTTPAGSNTGNSAGQPAAGNNTNTSNNNSSAGSSSASSSSTSSSGNAAFSPSANWANRPDGPYNLADAISDFKLGINGWNSTRMQISGGRLRTTLAKNVVGPDGGLVSWIDVNDGGEFQLQYDMMFANDFDFSAGGKVGFGFLLGQGYTGGQPASTGDGGSARIMWYRSGGRSYLKPYLYYKDQPGTYGDDFGKSYPATGSIAKGVWHRVKIYVKSNTGSSTNGRIRMEINGTVLLDQAIRWTTNDAKRLVNRICFETFRGGADASWTSPTDGQIYFDNVSWTALP